MQQEDRAAQAETSSTEEFKKLMAYIDELRSAYCATLSAFYTYKALREATDPDVNEASRATENGAIMSTFTSFFTPTKEALRVYFFIELAKLFDSSNQSLHIEKVINFTESNIKHMTVDAFEEYNSKQPRAFLDELVKAYRGISHADLVEIRNLLSAHSASLEKLRTYRDKWLAHNDIKKPDLPTINEDELRSLFAILEKILNVLTSNLNGSSSTWSHIERNAQDHTHMVLNYLHRFEPYRRKEIENEYSQETLMRS